jgi:hypothetical protein
MGYHDLPPFPEVAPDPTARNVSEPSPPPQIEVPNQSKKHNKEKSFYDSDSSPVDEGLNISLYQ